MFLDARAHFVLCKVVYCLCLRVLVAVTLGIIIDTGRAATNVVHQGSLTKVKDHGLGIMRYNASYNV